MKIAIYLAAVPKNKNELKLAVLRRFGEGAQKLGDQVQFVHDYNIVPADVAVMQGFVHNDLSSAHLQLRRKILDTNQNTLVIDSNLFQFANKDLANYYLRYSLNGIFPTTGFYFDNKIDLSRWTSISNRLGLSMNNYRSSGNHILICLQRLDGWSMCGTNVQVWLNNTVNELRKYTARPIIVRKHPGDKRQDRIVLPRGTMLSTNPSLLEDLRNCWATITYNSSPGIASLISGVPVFVTDKVPEHSQTYPICNTDLRNIENPALPDRQSWIDRISQSHWNDDEVISGQAWQFMRERLGILRPNLS